VKHANLDFSDTHICSRDLVLTHWSKTESKCRHKLSLHNSLGISRV